LTFAVSRWILLTTILTRELASVNTLLPEEQVSEGAAGGRPCVGPQIKRVRRDRGLTLTQVAEGSGLNVGYLSQIENDKALPSLEALAAIGRALEVPIAWFLTETTEPPRVVRAAERRSWAGPNGGQIDEVDGGQSRDLRVVMATIPVGMSTGLHAHAGEEHHLVLSGSLRIRQGEHEVVVGEGDYFVWDATIPHDAEVIGDSPVSVVIMTLRAHGPEFARASGRAVERVPSPVEPGASPA
jgi:transcriptional regulator with XRE-family HTH domain